jgi:hypothetical protein
MVGGAMGNRRGQLCRRLPSFRLTCAITAALIRNRQLSELSACWGFVSKYLPPSESTLLSAAVPNSLAAPEVELNYDDHEFYAGCTSLGLRMLPFRRLPRIRRCGFARSRASLCSAYPF